MSASFLPHGPGHGCSHTVQFYSEDEAMVDSIAELVDAALQRGDGAVCLMTRAHHASLARHLRARGNGAMKAVADGRYLPLPAEDTLERLERNGELRWERFSSIIGAGLEWVRRATGNPNAKVLAVGEMVGVLWAQGRVAQVIRLEDMWNELGQKKEFSLRCCYSMGAFDQAGDDEPFLKICSRHTGVIPSEPYPVTGTEDERLRAVAALQQSATSLRREVAELRLQALWSAPLDGQETADTAPLKVAEPAGGQAEETQAELGFLNETRFGPEEASGRQEWQNAYEAALLEGDLAKMFERVEEAEAAIVGRLDQLQHQATESRECRDLMYAWGVVRLVRRRKLGIL